MNRIIGHLDLDYFFAQVEEVENPALKQSPVVICVYSGRTVDSGVVSTSNYKARESGVKSGMPIYLAKRRLAGKKEAVFIPMDHEKYEEYSSRIMNLVRNNVDRLEQTGIDEAFFDITDRSRGNPQAAKELASEIKRQIYIDEKLTCSIGLGPNKVVAKIASDFKKPNGFTEVDPAEVISFLHPMPVDKLYGVGPKTTKILNQNGISSIADLAGTSIEKLQTLFDKKLAIYLHNASNGIDEEPVIDRIEASQLSRMITLKADTDDADEILAQLIPAVDDVHEKLVTKNLFFKTISVIGILRTLSLHTKSKTLESPTNDRSTLEKGVRDLLTILLGDVGALRRVGVRVSDLTNVIDQSSLMEFMR